MALAQRWPDVVQPTKYNFGCAIFMLAQRWPYIVSQHNFQISSSTFWCWPNVGPTLCTQRQLSANGRTVCQRWSNVVMLSGPLLLCLKHIYCYWKQFCKVKRRCKASKEFQNLKCSCSLAYHRHVAWRFKHEGINHADIIKIDLFGRQTENKSTCIIMIIIIYIHIFLAWRSFPCVRYRTYISIR